MADDARYGADPITHEAPSFEITHEADPSGVLLAGFSQFGLAGLTAVDFLVDQLELEQTGHVSVDALPPITPFEDGAPRHHTRFFSRPDLDLTVLVNELFVPLLATDAFSSAITDWIDDRDVGEVAVVSGVPIPHGPEDHRTFYVATPDYEASRLSGIDVPPMGAGFLDGVNARVVESGLDSPLAACVFLTPVHGQVPDVEAAIRLVETVDAAYGLGVDAGPLEAYATEVEDYYAELNERVEQVADQQRGEDRMFS